MQQYKIKFFPAALILYEVVVYLANDMYLPALPNIERELLTSQELTQYTLAVWFIGTGTVQLILGPLSDYYGRRLVLLFGNGLFILATCGCAIAPNIYILLLARFFQGGTVTFVYVAGYAAIHELYNSKKTIQILAIMSSVSIIGPAIGPLLGAVITEYSHWRYIFWALVWGGILSFAFLYSVMPEIHREDSSMHLSGVLRDYKKVITNTKFLRFTLIFCFMLASTFVWIVEGPFVFINTFHTSKIFFGVAQAIVFGCFIIGAQLAKHLIIKYQANRLLKIGLTIALLGAIIFCISAYITNLILLPILSMSIISLGTSILLGSLNRLTIESTLVSTGRTMAVFSTIISVFGGISSLGVTLIVNKTFIGLATIILICIFIAVILYATCKTPILLKDEYLESIY